MLDHVLVDIVEQGDDGVGGEERGQDAAAAAARAAAALVGLGQPPWPQLVQAELTISGRVVRVVGTACIVFILHEVKVPATRG
jgi:hypothetical protein